ncbi:MAG: helicase-related protein [Spirochaetota bacterium]
MERLNRNDLDVVFAVDMFNEGVDLPDVDTVMMLRPTESRVLWLQQFGRGLRVAEGKASLRVIDYIGNHRAFLVKPRALFELGPGDHEIVWALEAVQRGELGLPPGCEVTYELEAVDILRSLLRVSGHDALRAWYLDFRGQHGQRPKAVEAFHEGFTPRAVRKSHGSWLRFVDHLGDLPGGAGRLLAEPGAGGFLDHLEVTAMTRSFKMVVVQAMLDAGRFPGEMDIEALARGFARIAGKSAPLKAEVQPGLDDAGELRRYLEKNPVHFWSRGPCFSYEGGRFRTTFHVAEGDRELFEELVGEIVDWRLAEYLQRVRARASGEGAMVCTVSRAGRQPMLFLPGRKANPDMPRGWTEVTIYGERYEANFVKVAVNVVRKKGQAGNELPEVLRRWFGFRAGLPGTSFKVVFRPTDTGYVLEPLG